jgi:glycine dehydrogenase subunit 2
MELIFEISKQGRKGYSLPTCDVPEIEISDRFRRKKIATLPEVSEPQVMRHFVNLSSMNVLLISILCSKKKRPKVP